MKRQSVIILSISMAVMVVVFLVVLGGGQDKETAPSSDKEFTAGEQRMSSVSTSPPHRPKAIDTKRVGEAANATAIEDSPVGPRLEHLPDFGSGNPLESLTPAEKDLFSEGSLKGMSLSVELHKKVLSKEITEQEAISELEATSKEMEKGLRELMGNERFSQFERRMVEYGAEMLRLEEEEGVTHNLNSK